MSKMQIEIQVREHRATGLLMAQSDDLPGFVVHAHSDDELMEKLGIAFKDFMEAIGKPVSDVEIIKDETSPGFWPPAYIAKGSLDKAA